MNQETNSTLLENQPTHRESPNWRPDEHPVATGVGLVGGGAAGAAVGLTVGGPVGAVVGAVIGAVVGGVGGSAMAEATDTAGAESEAEADGYEPLMILPTHEQIALRAYYIYESRGKVDGCDFGDWIQAERELYADARELRDALEAERQGMLKEAL